MLSKRVHSYGSLMLDLLAGTDQEQPKTSSVLVAVCNLTIGLLDTTILEGVSTLWYIDL